MIGAILGTFQTYFGYKNWNVNYNTSKFGIKLSVNSLFRMKNFDFECFSILADFDQFRLKIVYFYRNSIQRKSSEILFQLLGMSCSHENWQMNAEKYFKKLKGGRIFIFWILLIFGETIGQKNLPINKNWKIKILP